MKNARNKFYYKLMSQKARKAEDEALKWRRIAKKPRSTFEKAVILTLINFCVWFPTYSILTKSHTITIHNVVNEAEASYDPCGLKEVQCMGEDTGGVPEDKPALTDKDKDTDRILALINTAFGDEAKVAQAVFYAESHHNPQSMNWNCRYFGKSQSCHKGDEAQAWSVDCGIAQINVLGKTCPVELFNPEHNLAIAKQMYDSRGWSPWVSHWNGSYLKYL
jgi:hypothetical protein